jgi:16S rRNA (guanine527-N7)-methyltransferase
MSYPPAGPGEEFASGPESVPTTSTSTAARLFGDRLPLAEAYAELLCTEGVRRGLIGPREAPRIWERHLLNCAVVAELLPTSTTIFDVGSGAGLPGLVLAIARPDLAVVLIEPLARRTVFLTEAVGELGLADTVTVFRGRAEEWGRTPETAGFPAADVVTARAVAPLDRLAGWCLPLARSGGRLLALKGATAAEEIAEHAGAVARLGGGDPVLRQCGVGVIEPPTTVVEIVRERIVETGRRSAEPRQPAKSRRPRRSAAAIERKRDARR